MSRLPPGWSTAPLGDVVEVLDSRRIPVNAKERAQRPGDVPYYGATGQVGWIDEPIFDEELVLLGEDGAPFLDASKPKAYLIDGPSWVNNHAHVLRAMPGVTTNRFVKYALDAADFRPHVNGTTRLKLTQKAMNSMAIPLPPPEEQERIVTAIEEHLSHLDAANDALRSTHRRMEVLQQRLVDVAIESKVVHLGDLLREPLRNGLSARASSDGSIRVVTLTAVTKAAFVDGNTKLIDPGARPVDDLWMQPGDIFIQRSNTPELVGTAALFEGPAEWAIFPDLLIRVRVDRDRVDPRYLALVLRSTALRRYFQRSAQGIAGSMPKISQPVVEAAPVPLPTLERQREILGKVGVETEFAGRLGLEARLAGRRAESLRRSILAAAFSGQLVPQDPDDEPASVLLERIRAERAAAKPAKRTRKARVS